MGRKPNPNNCCIDCGKYAIKHREDYFMANNDLWKTHGVGRGVLCLACFKKRLARKLRSTDFTDANVNKVNPELRKLLGGRR